MKKQDKEGLKLEVNRVIELIRKQPMEERKVIIDNYLNRGRFYRVLFFIIKRLKKEGKI